MRSFTGDDSGVSVLLEYIFTIGIASVLFAILLTSLGSTMYNSDRIVVNEELDIAASIVANQLASYSNELYLNDITLQLSDYTSLYTASATQDSARYFDVPRPYGGKQYSINVTDDGTGAQRGIVKVTYLSDASVYSVATFNSPVPVQPVTIICNTYNLKAGIVTVGGSKYINLEEV